MNRRQLFAATASLLGALGLRRIAPKPVEPPRCRLVNPWTGGLVCIVTKPPPIVNVNGGLYDTSGIAYWRNCPPYSWTDEEIRDPSLSLPKLPPVP